jgi:putative membrane protein
MRIFLKKLILAVLANGFAMWAVSEIFPDRIQILSDSNVVGFIVTGVSVGMINTFIKPILKILSLPLIIITVGLFLFVINALVLWLVEWILSDVLVALPIEISITGGTSSYVIVGFALGVINTFLHWFLREKRKH